MSNDYDPLEIEANAELRAKQAQGEKEEVEQDIEDLKWLMRAPQGRRLMWRILTFAGLYQTTFTGNSQTFLNEGRKQIGYMFIDEIHGYCPEQYTTMVKEQKKNGKRASASKRNDDGGNK